LQPLSRNPRVARSCHISTNNKQESRVEEAKFLDSGVLDYEGNENTTARQAEARVS
jgi:hypothetical protein